MFPLKIGKKASDSDEIKVERGPSPRCERGEDSRGEFAGLLEAERFHTGPETSVMQLDHLAHNFQGTVISCPAAGTCPPFPDRTKTATTKREFGVLTGSKLQRDPMTRSLHILLLT